MTDKQIVGLLVSSSEDEISKEQYEIERHVILLVGARERHQALLQAQRRIDPDRGCDTMCAKTPIHRQEQ